MKRHGRKSKRFTHWITGAVLPILSPTIYDGSDIHFEILKSYGHTEQTTWRRTLSNNFASSCTRGCRV